MLRERKNEDQKVEPSSGSESESSKSDVQASSKNLAYRTTSPQVIRTLDTEEIKKVHKEISDIRLQIKNIVEHSELAE